MWAMKRSWASRIVVLMHTFTFLSQIVLIDGESYVYAVTFVSNWSVHQKWIQKNLRVILKLVQRMKSSQLPLKKFHLPTEV